MNLLGYYMSHSFINQIKKLLHTWVVVFILVCGLMGGVIGVGLGSMANRMDHESKKVEKQMKDKDKDQDLAKDLDMKDLMKHMSMSREQRQYNNARIPAVTRFENVTIAGDARR